MNLFSHGHWKRLPLSILLYKQTTYSELFFCVFVDERLWTYRWAYSLVIHQHHVYFCEWAALCESDTEHIMWIFLTNVLKFSVQLKLSRKSSCWYWDENLFATKKSLLSSLAIIQFMRNYLIFSMEVISEILLQALITHWWGIGAIGIPKFRLLRSASTK